MLVCQIKILKAMRKFEMSPIVLGQKDPKSASPNLLRLFTTPMIGYKGTDNHFRVLYVLYRIIGTGIRP